MGEVFYLITFENTYELLKAEKILLENSADIKIIPTPRKISFSCGKSIRINHNLEETKEFLMKIEYIELYKANKTFIIDTLRKIKI